MGIPFPGKSARLNIYCMTVKEALEAVQAVQGQEHITEPPEAIRDALDHVYELTPVGYIRQDIRRDPDARLLKQVIRHLKRKGGLK